MFKWYRRKWLGHAEIQPTGQLFNPLSGNPRIKTKPDELF